MAGRRATWVCGLTGDRHLQLSWEDVIAIALVYDFSNFASIIHNCRRHQFWLVCGGTDDYTEGLKGSERRRFPKAFFLATFKRI